jgi:hypothetical protein
MYSSSWCSIPHAQPIAEDGATFLELPITDKPATAHAAMAKALLLYSLRRATLLLNPLQLDEMRRRQALRMTTNASAASFGGQRTVRKRDIRDCLGTGGRDLPCSAVLTRDAMVEPALQPFRSARS